MNNYNVKTSTRTAVPRSKRLREIGMNATQAAAQQQGGQGELPASLVKIIKNLDSWFGFDRDANAVFVKQNSDGESVNFYTYGQLAGGGFRSSGGGGGGTVTAIRLGSGTTPIGPTPGTTIIDLDPYPTATSLGLKALAYKDALVASDIPTLAISKVSGLRSALDGKQATISDLADIRSGAALGATAVQSVKTINLVSLVGGGNITLATLGVQAAITSSNKLDYSLISGTPTSLPASDVYDWAKASTKPSYALSELTGDSTHRVVTDTQIMAWGNKYDKPSGGIPKTDLASAVQTSLGRADSALQSHQTIYALTLQAGAFTAGTYTPNSAAKTINIPTTTSHISEGTNLYFTNARAISATDGTYLKLTGGTVNGDIDIEGSFTVDAGISSTLYVGDCGTGNTIAILGNNGLEIASEGEGTLWLYTVDGTDLKIGNGGQDIMVLSYMEGLDASFRQMGVSSLRIGSYILSVDSTAGALKLSKSDGTAAHFFTTGQMSAGGFASSGGSGGGTVTAIKVNGTTYSPTSGTTVVNLPDYPTATSLGLKALAYKASLTSNEVISYLGYTPLSTAGGTISAAGYHTQLTINRTDTIGGVWGPSVAFAYGGTVSGAIGMGATFDDIWTGNAGGTNRYSIYHAGNFIAGTNYVTPSGLAFASVNYATSAGSVDRATFGDSGHGDHDCNHITSNGLWYYNSNGPATTMGASTNDGALYSQAYSTSWVGQIAQDYRTGCLFVRSKNNGTWTAWKTVFDSSNFIAGTNYITPSGLTSALSGYLPLSGGTMTGDIVLPSESSNWNFGRYESKFRLVACRGTAATGAPGTYYAGMSAITAYVGFQLVTYGGATDDLNFRKLDENGTWHNWYNIYHSGNSNNTSTAWSASSLTLNGAITGATNITASGNMTVGTSSAVNPHIAFTNSSRTFYVQANGDSIGIGRTWGAGVHITGSGNVGIGTSNPTELFDVIGKVLFRAGGAGASTITSDLDAIMIVPSSARSTTIGTYFAGIAFNHLRTYSASYTNEAHGWMGLRLHSTPAAELSYLVFATKSNSAVGARPTEKMCIAPDGNVGIGTTTPDQKLVVAGNMYATGQVSAGGFTSSSDRKFKDNISLMTDGEAISLIKALRPSSWDWNELSSNNGRGHGFIAQEVSPYLPESVREVDGHLTLNYTDLHAFEVKALQCHESRIERLERENRELKAQVADLTKRLNA